LVEYAYYAVTIRRQRDYSDFFSLLSEESFKMATAAAQPFERQVADIQISKSDVNNLIMDYLITEGYPSAAEKFAAEANIQPKADLSCINERVQIRESIHRGDLQAAIELINDYYAQKPDFSALTALPPNDKQERGSTTDTPKQRVLFGFDRTRNFRVEKPPNP